MRHATPVHDPRGTMSASQLAALGFLARYERNTFSNYQTILRGFFTWCADHDLDPLECSRAHLELWVRHLAAELHNGPATIHHKVGVITGFYKTAVVDECIDRSPADNVRRPRVFTDHTAKVGLTRDELGALIQAGAAGRPSEGALIALLGMLGLRISEACAVRVEVRRRGPRTPRPAGRRQRQQASHHPSARPGPAAPRPRR